MKLTINNMKDGEPYPIKYTREGEDVSPSVKWKDLPPGTEELALIFENETEPFVQWLVYRIDPGLGELPEGIKHRREPGRAPVEHGTNSRGNTGYDGPLGTERRRYRYKFILYALNAPLNLPPGMDKEAFMKAAKPHILDTAEVNTEFVRPKQKA